MRPAFTLAFTFMFGATLVACGGDTGRADASTSVTTAQPTATDPGASTGASSTDVPTSGTGTGGSATDSASSNPGDTTDATSAGPTTSPDTDASTGAATATTTDTTTADTTTADTTTGVMPEACPCPDDLLVPLDDGIFVLSKTAVLWKYLPGANKFEMLGPIKCDVAPSTFSMGVDREGYAWVQFSDLQIRKVDITNVSDCSDPGFVPLQDGVENFGMAFVSNSAEDKCDRIYGNHYNGVAMGKGISEFFSVDPMTLDLVQLGKSDYGLAEVSGTGDGRAFLFAGPDPADLIEVDKNTGATISTIPLPGVKTGGGFAFAFFAGDFYFFTDAESDGTSEVTHIDYDDSDKNGKQDLKVVLQDAPLRVVGAGVSTCAPLIPQ
ncbi:hypothetical protein [Nannocystis sp.]|uniref:hypothetical protein n=1 Tax=Nannocystis sp. TaxID=1962667 RepID=UPI0025FEACBA|nr:hypothetical protein [Nannocystis sp.]MBK7828979.1 hypothetical protein [Nannocystis sp.]